MSVRMKGRVHDSIEYTATGGHLINNIHINNPTRPKLCTLLQPLLLPLFLLPNHPPDLPHVWGLLNTQFTP